MLFHVVALATVIVNGFIYLYMSNLLPNVSTVSTVPNTVTVQRHKVMIVIPYRNRETNLKFYRHYMENFFLRDQREKHPWTVFKTLVVEQQPGKMFNRGVLGNVGVRESIKRGWGESDCVIMHDVDLLPVPGVDYNRCDKAYSLSRSIQNKYKDTWHVMPGPYYGGVITMSIRDWEACNGFDNTLYGWGGEDDLLFVRCVLAGVIKGGDIQNHVHHGGELRYFNIHGSRDYREAKNKTSLDRYHDRLKNDKSDKYKGHGLNDVKYTVTDTTNLDGDTVKIRIRI